MAEPEIIVDDLPEEETESFGFISFAKDAVIAVDNPIANPPAYSSLFAIASGCGLFALAVTGGFMVGRTVDLRTRFASTAKSVTGVPIIPVPEQITALKFTFDEKRVIVVGSQGSIAWFTVESCISQGAKSHPEGIRKAGLVTDVKCNPANGHVVALLTSTGVVYRLDVPSGVIVQMSPAGVTAFDWAHNGRMIIAGNKDGILVQYDLQGNSSLNLPHPEVDFTYVCHISWLRQGQFLVIYSNPPEPGKHEYFPYIVSLMAAHKLKFSQILDVCPPFGVEQRPGWWYSLSLRGWSSELASDLILLACTPSIDISLMSTEHTLYLDDTKRASLPFFEGKDTSPVALVLDYTAVDKVKNPIPSASECAPLPLLWVMNEKGQLKTWSIVWAEGISKGVATTKPLLDQVRSAASSAAAAPSIANMKSVFAAPSADAPSQTASPVAAIVPLVPTILSSAANDTKTAEDSPATAAATAILGNSASIPSTDLAPTKPVAQDMLTAASPANEPTESLLAQLTKDKERSRSVSPTREVVVAEKSGSVSAGPVQHLPEEAKDGRRLVPVSPSPEPAETIASAASLDTAAASPMATPKLSQTPAANSASCPPATPAVAQSIASTATTSSSKPAVGTPAAAPSNPPATPATPVSNGTSVSPQTAFSTFQLSSTFSNPPKSQPPAKLAFGDFQLSSSFSNPPTTSTAVPTASNPTTSTYQPFSSFATNSSPFSQLTSSTTQSASPFASLTKQTNESMSHAMKPGFSTPAGQSRFSNTTLSPGAASFGARLNLTPRTDTKDSDSDAVDEDDDYDEEYDEDEDDDEEEEGDEGSYDEEYDEEGEDEYDEAEPVAELTLEDDDESSSVSEDEVAESQRVKLPSSETKASVLTPAAKEFTSSLSIRPSNSGPEASLTGSETSELKSVATSSSQLFANASRLVAPTTVTAPQWPPVPPTSSSGFALPQANTTVRLRGPSDVAPKTVSTPRPTPAASAKESPAELPEPTSVAASPVTAKESSAKFATPIVGTPSAEEHISDAAPDSMPQSPIEEPESTKQSEDIESVEEPLTDEELSTCEEDAEANQTFLEIQEGPVEVDDYEKSFPPPDVPEYSSLENEQDFGNAKLRGLARVFDSIHREISHDLSVLQQNARGLSKYILLHGGTLGDYRLTDVAYPEHSRDDFGMTDDWRLSEVAKIGEYVLEMLHEVESAKTDNVRDEASLHEIMGNILRADLKLTAVGDVVRRRTDAKFAARVKTRPLGPDAQGLQRDIRNKFNNVNTRVDEIERINTEVKAKLNFVNSVATRGPSFENLHQSIQRITRFAQKRAQVVVALQREFDGLSVRSDNGTAATPSPGRISVATSPLRYVRGDIPMTPKAYSQQRTRYGKPQQQLNGEDKAGATQLLLENSAPGERTPTLTADQETLDEYLVRKKTRLKMRGMLQNRKEGVLFTLE
ncbi:uncharacterized protein V1518DRAFT_414495 [Limtongia smithiae]|uniref:uncharacterized protein n=1 Tax=Limtongia smithiae TaxID=1125753 RepID=UPI0034CE2D0A